MQFEKFSGPQVSGCFTHHPVFISRHAGNGAAQDKKHLFDLNRDRISVELSSPCPSNHTSFLLQILYTGKSQALGIKQGGPAANKWAELPITKSPKVVQYSVGHESQHALLVTEDGSVFFVGTAKRGEDGDSSLCKFVS